MIEGKNRNPTIKESKICIRCGKQFEGIYSAFTCSPTCRNGMNRMIKRGQVPKYYLAAMKNYQKVPKLAHQREIQAPVTPPIQTKETEPVPYHLKRLQIKNK